MASPSEIAALEIRITGVEKAMSQFSSFQQTTTKTMSASEAAVTRSLKNMVSQFVGVAAAARAVQNVVSSGVGFNQFVENTTTSFTVMMKSAEKAKQQMKDLYDFAVSSPLTFKETAASSKQLMAYGFAAKELIPTMKTLGTVAIATGHSLDDISYVYGTLKSQGRAYSRDLMQFGMRGIPIYEELAKVLSVDVKQIQKMASEGKIGFAEVEKAFQNMTSSGGRFSGIIEGYMSTLTGKLSMLSDIAEQSAGTLTSGVTDQLKVFVDSLTNVFKSKGFQKYIEDMGSSFGLLASALGIVLTLVIKLAPVLTKLLTVWIAFGAVQIWYKLPTILMGMAKGIAGITASTLTSTSATVGLGFAWDKVLLSITASSGAMLSLLGPIAAVVVAIGGISNALKEAQRTAKMIKDKEYFEQEIVKQASGSTTGGMGVSIKGFNAKDQVFYIQKMAEKYGQSSEEVAKILYFSKLVSAEAASIAGFNVDAWVAEQKNAQWAEKTAKELSNRQFISTLEAVGLSISDWDTYVKEFQQSAEFLKNPSNFKGIAQMVQPNLKWETEGILENLPSVDIVKSMLEAGVSQGTADTMLESILTKRVETLQGYLVSLIQRDAINPEDTNPLLQKWLAQQLNDAQKQLAGFSGKAGKAAQELAKWWAPLVQAAKLTLDPLDDIDIAMQQAQESAKKEFDSRQAQYDLLTSQTKDEQLILKYQQDKTAEAALFAQYQQDITKEYEKQKNLATYNQIVSGNEGYWSNMQAEAGKQYRKGSAFVGAALQGSSQLMQGTQVGTAMSNGAGMGVDILSGMVTAMVSFLQSIENVNKVLNPFSTIIEAARSVLEPLINQSLQPIVNILEMVGEVLGELLRPVIAVSYIIKAIMYPAFSVLVGILQIVGGAFTWLYDTVIVPVGNMIVNIVNAIIKVLNKIPFVHIRYLDALETSTEALKDYSDAAENAKSSLSDTISYLEDKLSDMIDEQISSFQDLYEVGAISASEYADAVKNINAQSINKDTALVSLADQQLGTQAEILARLSELYQVQEILNTSTLTDKQIANLLNDAGLTSTSIENVLIGQIDRILAAMGQTTATVTAPEDTSKYDAVIAALQDTVKGTDAVKAMRSMVSALSEAEIVSLAKVIGVSDDKVASSTAEELRKYVSVLAAMMETKWNLTGMGGAGLSVGTTNVPYDNFPATLHKGEAVVPSTFMDGIRSGELVMSSGGASSEGTVNVYVSVEGSVTAEDDLATTIATNIYKQRKLRTLTV